METFLAQSLGQVTDRYRAATLQLARTEEMLQRAREVEEYGAADALRHLLRDTDYCSTPVTGAIVGTGRGVGPNGEVSPELDATGIDYLYVVRRRSYTPSALALSSRGALDLVDMPEEDAARALLDRRIEARVLKRDLRVGARRLPRTKPCAVLGCCDLSPGVWDTDAVFSGLPEAAPVRIAAIHPAARQFLGLPE